MVVNGFVGWLAPEDRVAGAVVAVDAVVNDARIAADAKLLRGDVAGGLAAEVGIELDESPERNVR